MISKVPFLPTLPSLLVERNVPFVHRDLSWLQFNERVLAEARQATNPILERAKFLSITASNIDEFFMIRFASLSKSLSMARRKEDRVLQSRLEHIRSAILEAVAKFGAKQVEALDLLSGELSRKRILIRRSPWENETVANRAQRIFEEQIFPHLGEARAFTPASVLGLENLQMAALFQEKSLLAIPRKIPTVFVDESNSAGVSLFFSDELIGAHLHASLFRVIRDCDFSQELHEDSESIPDTVLSRLRTRERGRAMCLFYSPGISGKALGRLESALRLSPERILPAPSTLCLHGLRSAVSRIPEEIRTAPDLSYPPLRASLPRTFSKPQGIFESLRERDRLLHHPYDSFDGYVGWIRQACEDPDVKMIEQTVYRTDTISPVIGALKKAAGTKRVRVVVELRARFDELNNIRLAEDLRAAGVEVSYGFGKLKLHAKIALITRQEEGAERRYTHLSTGNYNAATARQYTDLALFTANPEIGEDARHFFDSVVAGEVPTTFKRLVPAPTKLHRRVLSLIETEIRAAEAGKPARIFAKVNALVDEEVIEALYRASRAGVRVDLIVRGACSLIPGVAGLSERIRVISVVDRLLEHSRIYYFENSRSIYLSSADWMQRNFFSRLEVAFPILDPKLHEYIEKILIPTYLADTVKGKELTPQGTWKRRSSGSSSKAVRSQMAFEELAVRGYQGTPLE